MLPIHSNKCACNTASLYSDLSSDAWFDYGALSGATLVVAPGDNRRIYTLSDYLYEINLYHPSDYDLETGCARWHPLRTLPNRQSRSSGATNKSTRYLQNRRCNTVTSHYVWSDADQAGR